MADGSEDTKLAEKKGLGGVEGPEAMYVKLIASDGHEFVLRREHALTSGTIKAMLSGPGTNVCCLASQGANLSLKVDDTLRKKGPPT